MYSRFLGGEVASRTQVVDHKGTLRHPRRSRLRRDFLGPLRGHYRPFGPASLRSQSRIRLGYWLTMLKAQRRGHTAGSLED